MTQPHPIHFNGIVDSVTMNGFCTGCGLCESIAPTGHIQMMMSGSGYLRPAILKPLSMSATNQIEQVCPGIRIVHSAGISGYHPIWGPLVSVHTGHALDTEIRRQGSSGGVISALLVHLLTTGKVDFVAQIASSDRDPLGNELQLSHTREDVIYAAGSRYAPSAPLRRLRELLATGKKFAFVGKPCDIAALRRYGDMNQAVKRQVPFMLSFMCAGIPSIKGTHEIINQIGADQAKVVSFRYRGDGWPGMARVVQCDGQSFEMDYRTSWGTILNKHLQFRCKICPDGTGEFADVICADAWYGKDGYPDFAERDGRSLVIARTSAGAALIAAAVHDKAVLIEDLAIGEVEKMQPYQADRKRLVLGRRMATRLARGTAPCYVRLGLWNASLGSDPIRWLRSAWGTFRRAKAETQ